MAPAAGAVPALVDGDWAQLAKTYYTDDAVVMAPRAVVRAVLNAASSAMGFAVRSVVAAPRAPMASSQSGT